MQITVFGASGRVGQLVVKRALSQGHTVRAFVHKTNPFGDADGVTVVQGSFDNDDSVNAALQDSQAVISALGSWGTKDKKHADHRYAGYYPGYGSAGSRPTYYAYRHRRALVTGQTFAYRYP